MHLVYMKVKAQVGKHQVNLQIISEKQLFCLKGNQPEDQKII